jgi:hypothetical protein
MKFGPKIKNSPRPARPQTALRMPGRHVARDGNQPTGPLALSASRAPGRNLGLGRESFFLPRSKLGPVIVSHPSQSNGCARFSAEQNRARRPRANPSPHSVCLRPMSGAAKGARLRRRLEPLAGVRAHRWVDAPPSSGLSGLSSRLLALTR